MPCEADRRRVHLVALTAPDPESSLEAQVFGRIGRHTAEFLTALSPPERGAVLDCTRLTTRLLTEARQELRDRPRR